MRGGVSLLHRYHDKTVQSSPRAWGCFFFKFPACKFKRVFPTCVGVFLRMTTSKLATRGLPHVRGGVSATNVIEFEQDGSSPRAWGCF